MMLIWPDLRLRPLADFENDINAVLVEADTILGAIRSGKAALTAVKLDDPRNILPDGGARENLARRELDFLGDLVGLQRAVLPSSSTRLMIGFSRTRIDDVAGNRRRRSTHRRTDSLAIRSLASPGRGFQLVIVRWPVRSLVYESTVSGSIRCEPSTRSVLDDALTALVQAAGVGGGWRRCLQRPGSTAGGGGRRRCLSNGSHRQSRQDRARHQPVATARVPDVRHLEVSFHYCSPKGKNCRQRKIARLPRPARSACQPINPASLLPEPNLSQDR